MEDISANKAARTAIPVKYLSQPTEKLEELEELFQDLREKELRTYSDKELRKLPYATKANPHVFEWKHRARSLQRFLKYIHDNPQHTKVLEIGCGNGWFSYYVASAIATNAPSTMVTGLDVDRQELEKAARNFSRPNLEFVYGDLEAGIFKPASFDIIVLANTVQFLPELAVLIPKLQALLIPGGEIHIIDSPFFKKSKVAKRSLKTEVYYQSLGMPQVLDIYRHHTYDDVKKFNYKLLYNPRSKRNTVKKLALLKPGPHPWIRIR